MARSRNEQRLWLTASQDMEDLAGELYKTIKTHNLPISTIIGILEIVKNALLQESIDAVEREGEGDEDED